MSYATYLANKLASEKKVVTVKKPTDASMITQKRRLEASQIFFADGYGKGSLAMDTSRPNGTPLLQHATTSFTKATTRPAAASDYTAFRGSQGIRDDAAYLTGGVNGRKTIDGCVPVPNTLLDPKTGLPKYRSAGDATKTLHCVNEKIGDSPKFVDNTIRLSAMQPDMIQGCPDGPFVTANHEHSEGIHPPSHPSRAVNNHIFMASPPEFQNQGVGGARIGAYYNPRSGYVENKHGNDLGVNPKRVPVPFVISSNAPAHLKINNPTFADVKF